MSILIKGIEMPKEDELLCIRIYPSGKVTFDMDLQCKQIAEAVELPDHGDLIDRDEIKVKAEFIGDAFTGRGGYAVWGTDLLSAPVVLPAERSEDETN